MKCARCNQENPPSAKFCLECGVALHRICPQCSASLPPAAKFCPECGRPWQESSPAGAKTSAASPRAEPVSGGERRHATVLFADIAGYTRMCAQTDAEKIQAMLNVFYECVDGIVSAYGGHVVDHAGDGVLAVFGAPVAHGNDAERAVRAAFDMHQGSACLLDPLGQPVGLHIGIGTGEVVAANITGGAHPRYSITGDTVNLAARLAGVASRGQSVLSENTYRTVEHIVECSSLGTQALKGMDHPVLAWQAQGVRDTPSGGFPFAGRRLELSQLESLLANISKSGPGRCVLIRGDPGIGKSRLVEELRTRAGALGFECHMGQTLDFGTGKGQGAMPMILRGLLNISSAHGADAALQAVKPAADRNWVTQDELPFLLDMLDLPVAPALRSVLHAMDLETRNQRMAQLPSRIAERRAQASPVLIIAEDVHWASGDLLHALALLALATRENPILLVMTTRIQGDPLGSQWKAATPGTPLMTLDLGPLRPDEALAIASELVDRSEAFAKECIERSEGNPLYLVQLLLNARDSDAFQLPGTIQSLVLARMDRLSLRDKLALQAAAVIGFRFSLDTVRSLCGDAQYGCDALLSAGLIRPQEGILCFSHALIQEGIYASLLHARKRELHRMAAEHFRSMDPVLCAQHLDRAEDPRAPGAYLHAARKERESYRAERALSLLDRGLELAATAQDELELRIERGDLLPELGRADASLRDFERALAIARNDTERASAWTGMAGSMRISDRYDEALVLLNQAEAVARAADLKLDLARIHYLRGSLFFPLGRVSECLQEHEKALQFSREAGSAEWQVRALSGMGDAYYATGQLQSSYGNFEQCVALSRAHGLGKSEVANLAMVGILSLLFMTSPEVPVKISEEAVALARMAGQKRPLIIAHHACAMAYLLAEDAARARPHAVASVEIARDIGAQRFIPEGMMFVAKCLVLENKPEEALALLRDALELCRPAMHYVGPYVLAELAAATSDPAERDRCLAEGAQLLKKSSLAHNIAFYYQGAIDVWLQLHEWDRVEECASQLLAAFEREPVPLVSFYSSFGRAMARAGRGGHGEELANELRGLHDTAKQLCLAAYERRLAQAIQGLGVIA